MAVVIGAVTVIVLALMVDVEPEVRLSIALPASTKKGVLLPWVLSSQAVCVPLPQQKEV